MVSLVQYLHSLTSKFSFNINSSLASILLPLTQHYHTLPEAETDCVSLYLSFATAQSTATIRPVKQKSSIRKAFHSKRKVLSSIPVSKKNLKKEKKRKAFLHLHSNFLSDFLTIKDSNESSREKKYQFRGCWSLHKVLSSQLF